MYQYPSEIRVANIKKMRFQYLQSKFLPLGGARIYTPKLLHGNSDFHMWWNIESQLTKKQALERFGKSELFQGNAISLLLYVFIYGSDITV